MSMVVGIGGWLLGLAGLGLAAVIRIRLARQADAVARACHEVRGPLTAVRLGLELGGRLRDVSQSRLRAIELELARAAVALDDLSAVAAPRRTVQFEPVEVSQLVESSVEAWDAVAAVHGGTIVLDAPSQPIWVVGERLRIAQAVGNLLANAIEHGGGAIQVRLRSGVGKVQVEVADSGPGLPASIDRLVRRQARRGRTEHGHGLRIASRVAAAHGGRLALAPGDRGARMVLELPALSRPG